VKGQYLFYSFLPSVTAAVLTSQPALARTVSGFKLTSSPSALTFTQSQTWLAGTINTQLPNNRTQIFPDIVPESGLNTLDLQFSSGNNNSDISATNTGINAEKNPEKEEGKVSNFTNSLNHGANSEPGDVHSHQQQIQENNSKPQLQTTTSVFSLSSQATSQPGGFSLPLLEQQGVTTPEARQNQLSTTVPTTGATEFLGVASCSTASICPPTNLVTQNRQFNLQTTASGQDRGLQLIPALAVTPNFPAPNTSEVPVPPGTLEFAPTADVEIPETLIPSANPLQFPTQPEEVKLQTNQPITLTQALELAKRNNRDLQISVLELERSKAGLRQVQAALLPNISLNADITRSRSAEQQLGFEQEAQQLNVPAPQAQASTAFRGDAQLTYELFTSGRRRANIRRAEEQLRFTELNVERQLEEIRLNVSTEYYNLQQADERVRIAQSAVENSQASLQDAQALERAGVGTRFDVLQAQVNLANSQQELTNNLSQQQIARRRLATRLNIPQSVNLSAADPVELAGLWNQDLETTIILAFQNRPELQQQLARRNISEQERRAALAALGPQVSLIARYNLVDQFDDGVSVTDGYSVGVRATLNLYDGGAARASAAQAKTNVAIEETQFSEQRDQIRFQVEQAFSTQRANLENVQTANTALEQAREALRLARLRFQAGVGTQTDVINSENDLTRAEGNRITAILDYNRALAELQRAVTTRALAD
jgi:outer membrane protein TolC